MKKVILEGCNGEWAQQHYLPVLAGRAVKGNIELWVVDIEPQIKLSASNVAALWQAAQSNGKACYLDKTGDKESYDKIANADYVFIVAPDRFHSKIARHWLDRPAPEGKILFVEKPLDASRGSALKLKEKIEEKRAQGTVFAFAHYLARTHSFLKNKDSYLEKIGKISKIEFHILESPKILRQRERTLDNGMIFDLFCHVLALVGAVVNKNLTCSANGLQTVRLENVKAAQYTSCPISGETFAQIKFMINSDIEVISAVGKCVGTSDDKFVRLYGANGNIKLDFVKDMFFVFDSQVRQMKQGKLDSKPVESFIEGVLQGKKLPLSVPGVLSFDAALEILKILDEAKKQIYNMPEYRCKESINKILERL